MIYSLQIPLFRVAKTRNVKVFITSLNLFLGRPLKLPHFIDVGISLRWLEKPVSKVF